MGDLLSDIEDLYEQATKGRWYTTSGLPNEPVHIKTTKKDPFNESQPAFNIQWDEPNSYANAKLVVKLMNNLPEIIQILKERQNAL